jgi:hypothetical protein
MGQNKSSSLLMQGAALKALCDFSVPNYNKKI